MGRDDAYACEVAAVASSHGGCLCVLSSMPDEGNRVVVVYVSPPFCFGVQVLCKLL